MSQEQFDFKVEDPYDAYFGTGDPRITSQFTLALRRLFPLHPDRLRLARSRQSKSKQTSKFVLINTPFETRQLVNLRLKKKNHPGH